LTHPETASSGGGTGSQGRRSAHLRARAAGDDATGGSALLGRRARCLIAPRPAEEALGRALSRNLAAELPGTEFTLDDRGSFDTVWVCGYDSDRLEHLRRLRERHPRAFLLVTGKGSTEDWQAEVASAGADRIFAWPVALGSLVGLLAARHGVRRDGGSNER